MLIKTIRPALLWTTSLSMWIMDHAVNTAPSPSGPRLSIHAVTLPNWTPLGAPDSGVVEVENDTTLN
ncbi:hypothetical protein L1987_03092 [Smallanthus sonchifolius]|uniref:Uncharacterized protein n=1 Tax=Smallanthus sonchifolius TaxID=185202 RepID=A0ACB9K9R9_9ASTR|nr:hypothetical protein L1987_03092 [Smallanthus sonchifolius]